jgi:hypothetical protein
MHVLRAQCISPVQPVSDIPECPAPKRSKIIRLSQNAGCRLVIAIADFCNKIGTKRHFAPARQFGLFWTEADIGPRFYEYGLARRRLGRTSNGSCLELSLPRGRWRLLRGPGRRPCAARFLFAGLPRPDRRKRLANGSDGLKAKSESRASAWRSEYCSGPYVSFTGTCS